MSLAIGVDIGGTKVAAGVVDEHGAGARPRAARHARPRRPRDRGRHRRRRRDPAPPATTSPRWASARPGGSPTTTPRCCSRRTWPGATSRCGTRSPAASTLPLIIENDANAAAWAEYRFGVARGEPVVVCVTLGTGIGGGLVAGGEVYRGAFGIACEYGHMTLVPDGRPLRVRQPGLLGDVRLRARPGPRRPRARRRVAGRGGADCSNSPARPRPSPARSSPRRPLAATRPRGRSARPWAAGSGAGWPTSPRSSTRRSSSSAAGCRPPASCCSRPAREEFAQHPDRARVPPGGPGRGRRARPGRRAGRRGRPGPPPDRRPGRHAQPRPGLRPHRRRTAPALRRVRRGGPAGWPGAVPAPASVSTPAPTAGTSAALAARHLGGRGRPRLRARRAEPAALALEVRRDGPPVRAGRRRRRAHRRRQPAAVRPRRRRRRGRTTSLRRGPRPAPRRGDAGRAGPSPAPGSPGRGAPVRGLPPSRPAS